MIEISTKIINIMNLRKTEKLTTEKTHFFLDFNDTCGLFLQKKL